MYRIRNLLFGGEVVKEALFLLEGSVVRVVCFTANVSQQQNRVALKRSKETQLLPPLPPSWTSTARISTQLRPAQRS
jgi:hypothetical protein